VKVVDIKRLDVLYPIDGYYLAGTAKTRKQYDAYACVMHLFTSALRSVGKSGLLSLFPFSLGK